MRRSITCRAIALFTIALAVACSAALAGQAAQPTASQPTASQPTASQPTASQPTASQPTFWSKVFESTFGLILVFIFVPIIVTTFIAARQRDRCLKTFHKFHATVYTKTGQAIWGGLSVFSKGLVITYEDPVEAAGRPTKTSYMMYEADMENVSAVFRFHDRISEKSRRRRRRQIQRLAYPGFIGRTWRRIRNLINTLRDAFNKAIDAILGQMQRAKPQSQMLKTGGKEIGGIGTTLLGKVANAYEPLLESHIGTPVVLEISGPEEGAKKEYAGQLGEYSAAYLMVLDIDAEIEDKAVAGGHGAFDDQVTASRADDQVEITNGLSVDVRIVSVEVGGQLIALDHTVAANSTAALPLSLSEITPAAPPEASEGEDAPPPPPSPEALVGEDAPPPPPSSQEASEGEDAPLPPPSPKPLVGEDAPPPPPSSQKASEGEDAPPPPPPPEITVRLAARRKTDIMAPRAQAIIRHGGIGKQ